MPTNINSNTNTTDITSSLANEIASRDRVRISFGGMDLELPNPDPVLKKLGKDIEVYRDIMTDSTVKGARKRRRSSVVALEHGLEQGDASDSTMQLCELVLENIKLKQLIRELHDAVWFGYSPAEIYWSKETGYARTPSNSLTPSSSPLKRGSIKGKWLPEKVVGKPPEWFCYNHENALCFKDMTGMIFTPVPEYKFITARNDASFANPYGEAELASVYWYVVFKKGGLKFWLRFADKYGQAFIVGKHPRGTPQKEVDLILDSLEILSEDGVGAIPNDGSVEIMEASGKGATSDMFERLLNHCVSQINIALLGQDQSTNASSTNASAQAGLSVTDDIRDGDGEMIADAINELIRYVVNINIGEHEPVPVWGMWSNDEVTETQSNIDKNLYEMGFRPNKTYFQRKYKLKEDEFEVVVLDNNIDKQQGKKATDFSETLPQPLQKGGEYTPVRLDYADANTDKLGKQSQPIIDDWLQRIKATLDKATDINQLPDMIASEFSELPTDEMVEVIQLAMMAGELAGRAEVIAEASDE